jgi:hypothetical protein
VVHTLFAAMRQIGAWFPLVGFSVLGAILKMEQTIIIFFLALFGGLVFWCISLMQGGLGLNRATRYRDRFEQLIAEIEHVVIRANNLQSLANQLRDGVLLDHYLAALRMIETLMIAVKNLRSFGEDEDSLAAPIFLVKEIKQKLLKIESAMGRGLQGKSHEFMKIAPVMAQTVIGCHFCSRPFDAPLFGKVRVKVDGNTEEVAACVYCRERLLRTRKARVLFFDEDGAQVHWSKAKSWTPSPEYWDINRDDISDRGRTPHLELVYSNVSRISETKRGDD